MSVVPPWPLCLYLCPCSALCPRAAMYCLSMARAMALPRLGVLVRRRSRCGRRASPNLHFAILPSLDGRGRRGGYGALSTRYDAVRLSSVSTLSGLGSLGRVVG